MTHVQDYGQLFCDLAYDALQREENELEALHQVNPNARPMSVCGLDEVTLHFLIAKEALRRKDSPRIMGEVPYESGRNKLDLCFVRDLAGKQIDNKGSRYNQDGPAAYDTTEVPIDS